MLAVHPTADLYGSDLMFVRSVAGLVDAGHVVSTVLGAEGPLHDRLAVADVPVRTEPAPVLRKALLTPSGLARLTLDTPGSVRRLAAVLRAEDPDVLYLNTITAPHWLAAARLVGVPAVCHVRELESDAPRPLVQGMLAPLLAATAVLANSRATAHHLASVWPSLAGRTLVVHNGLRFPSVPGPPPLQGRPVVLTVVGRLSPRKGQDVALHALAGLVAAGVDARLRLVGTVFAGYEWFEERLRDDAERLGLADRVELTGYTTDVWSVYTSSDVVLVPSRLEPFGSVAAEASACRRPVVVSRTGGLPEIVEEGVTGLVVPRGDAQALASAVWRLVDDPDRAREMGVRGSELVRRRFGEARYGTAVSDALRSVVRQRRD